MMTLRLADLAQVLDARLIGGDLEITAVSTDTRTLGKGAVRRAAWRAFRRPRFLRPGCSAGASALLVERELPLAIPQLVVADTSRAGSPRQAGARADQPESAGHHRQLWQDHGEGDGDRHPAPEGEVLATAGNFNNEVGCR
jgi:UDP-N-acetylmuramoyl-tripeptide--D-alanyl-D-alanine ligase